MNALVQVAGVKTVLNLIKVMQVSSDTNIGGAGKCILTYLKYYDRKKFDVSLVLPKNSLLKPHAEKYGVTIYEIENIADKSLDFKAVLNLKKLFKQIKPDIVHTHASMSARIAARLCGIKIVYTRHSVFEPSPKISKGLGKKVNGFINNSTANSIIAVAEAAKDNLTQTGIRENKIDVILNGVEPLKKLSPSEIDAERNKWGITPGQKVAAIIARLNEVKGHKYVVEAAKILKSQNMNIKFLIAGTGEMHDEIQSQINEYNLEDTVILCGFLEDVTPIMNIMDIQINASFGTEATSLSLLEGMSLGKPAIVSDFGGNPGVISDGVNGFLFPKQNSSEMAEKLDFLLNDDSLYEKISHNCVKIYNSTFTAEVMTQNIEKIYEKVFN